MRPDAIYYEVPSPDLRGKLKPDKKSMKVSYPVSCSYNGGTIVDHKWYAGYRVGPPIIDDDCELVDICVGLELNAHPPHATKILRRKD